MVRTRRNPLPPRPAFCVCGHPELSNEAVACMSGRTDCPGQGLFHVGCVGLTYTEALEIPGWTCPECTQRQQDEAIASICPPQEESSGSDTEVEMEQDIGSASPPPVLEIQEESEDDGQDYAVEKIIRHGREGGRLKMEVKWVGYSETTWLWEDDLKFCYDLVKPYCDRRKIKTTLKPIGGASPVQPISNLNLNNWVTLEDLVKKLSYWRTHPSYTSNLELITIEAASKPYIKPRDGLYLVLFRGHFYVAIHDARLNLTYMSDSSNSVFEDPENKAFHISHYWKAPIKPLRFARSTRVDFCGSSAVCIALELVRLYNLGKLDCGLVEVPSARLKLLSSSLHKEQSAPTTGWVSISDRPGHFCESCGYRAKNRRALLMHERSHL